MLEFNISIETNDCKHDLHYLVKLKKPIDLLINCPPMLIQNIQWCLYE